MALKVVHELAHPPLLLTVKVKQDNLQPLRHFVETFINDNFIDEHVCGTKSQAIKQAGISLQYWSGRLQPVYDAGAKA